MKTIIEMAREAGFKIIDNMIFVDWWEINPYMQRFTELVRADEREACAKVCDELVAHRTQSHCDSEAFGAEDCAKAIRARGNT